MGSSEVKESIQDGYSGLPSISFFCFHFQFHELLGNSLRSQEPFRQSEYCIPLVTAWLRDVQGWAYDLSGAKERGQLPGSKWLLREDVCRGTPSALHIQGCLQVGVGGAGGGGDVTVTAVFLQDEK